MLALALAVALSVPAFKDKNADFNIVVSFSQKCLTVYDNRQRPIISYPVAVPRRSVRVKFPIIGEVIKSELYPRWYPTKLTIEFYKEHKNIKLPEIVEPNNPLNAMGEGKISIRFVSGYINPFSRIHGTYEDNLIGTRASSGCIRMHNRDIKALIELIRNRSVMVIYNE